MPGANCGITLFRAGHHPASGASAPQGPRTRAVYLMTDPETKIALAEICNKRAATKRGWGFPYTSSYCFARMR